MPQFQGPWSFSKWSMFNKCPFMFKKYHIDKVKQEETPALARGNLIHKMAELYIKGQAPLTGEIRSMWRRLDGLRAVDAEAESEWAFTDQWRLVGWEDPLAWLRLKIDAFVFREDRCTVIDFKTGKKYPEHKDQLSLYATAIFQSYSQPQIVQAADWYFDGGKIEKMTFCRNTHSMNLDVWTNRANEIYNERSFNPKKNWTCKYCPFKQECS